MDGLAGYILRRLMFVPVALLVVSFATFLITRWGPGDPVTVYAQQLQQRDPEAIERVKAKYGLDKPVLQQYGIWLRDVVTDGDFGVSFRHRDRTIPEILKPKIWTSIQVSLWAFVLSFAIGIPAGVYSAVKQGSALDPLIIGFLLFFQSIPVLVMTPVLVLVLAAELHWLPPGGFDGIFSKSVIIPTIVLTLPGLAGIARLSRAATLGTLHEDYVRTARAKGLREDTVVARHVARNSLVPVMTTVIGLSFVGLVEGAIITETLLGIPGVGSFMYESVTGRDYNVILAMVLLTTALFVLANLVVDLALIVMDPRVRRGGVAAR